MTAGDMAAGGGYCPVCGEPGGSLRCSRHGTAHGTAQDRASIASSAIGAVEAMLAVAAGELAGLQAAVGHDDLPSARFAASQLAKTTSTVLRALQRLESP